MKITVFVFCIIPIGMVLVSSMKKEMVSTSRAEGTTIETIQWFLTGAGGSPVSPLAGDRQPHILLDPAEKLVRGFSGCNTFFGSYQLDGASLTFGPLGATRMVCPDLETGLETAFFDALESTRTWKTVDGELLLRDGNDVLARFSTEQYVSLIGPVWQWMQTLYNDDRKVAPENPANYTVKFLEDGTVSVAADCNRKGGTFSSPRGATSISIDITRSTMAACPEGSLEDEFEQGLAAGAVYFLRDGDLYIDLKYDSGTMRFSRR